VNYKKCVSCGIRKDADSFYVMRAKTDGRSSLCKECGRSRDKARYEKEKFRRIDYASRYYQENKEKCKGQQRDYFHRNREQLMMANREWAKKNTGKMNEYTRRYRERNLEKCRARAREAAKKNPHIKRANVARRREALRNRLAEWGDKDCIRSFYTQAECFGRVFGGKWHVDHIIPIRAKKVSGLHVETNLRVVTEYENESKRNVINLNSEDVQRVGFGMDWRVSNFQGLRKF